MRDGGFQREDVNYLSFEFNGEIIDPEQYLIWHQMKEEEILQFLEEYGREISEL